MYNVWLLITFTIIENRLLWYGHLMRKAKERMPKKIWNLMPHGRNKRRKPRANRKDNIDKYETNFRRKWLKWQANIERIQEAKKAVRTTRWKKILTNLQLFRTGFYDAISIVLFPTDMKSNTRLRNIQKQYVIKFHT